MLKRLKVALVRSYVGAILIGWLAAQGITDAVNIFATPVMVWISRQLFPEPSNLFTPARNLTFPYLSGLQPFDKGVDTLWQLSVSSAPLALLSNRPRIKPLRNLPTPAKVHDDNDLRRCESHKLPCRDFHYTERERSRCFAVPSLTRRRRSVGLAPRFSVGKV